jgi:F0F1-type ATP synthase assembly protein I
MEEQEIKEKKDKRGISALFVPAGLFIGMGIGFLTDKLVPGMYIGLGVGFLLFIIFFLSVKK